jgi:hypothetical protein
MKEIHADPHSPPEIETLWKEEKMGKRKRE